MKKKIIVAITGATGSIYGIRMLEFLRHDDTVETHLVLSSAGALTAKTETPYSKESIQALADVVHHARDIGASIASGSFITAGMVIAPCSMKTLGSIANGIADNLIARAADVILKERRRLVLMVRETPFNLAHLRNMTAATEMGGIIAPPLPAFYTQPDNLDALINQSVGRTLELLGIDTGDLIERWKGVTEQN